MRAILLACLASFFIQCAFSQDTTGNKYLMVTIQQVWNKANKHYNYLLKADPDVAGASVFYALKPVLNDDEINYNHPVYAAVAEKGPLPDYKTGYNNFPNESSVLNFITTNGWQLHTVIPQVQSETHYGFNMESFSKVFSVTKYLFTRVVQ